MKIRSTLPSLVFPAVALIASAMFVAGCHKTLDDATLASNVKSVIAADNAISKQPIETTAQNGIVTLSGNVSDDTASAVAASDAAKVKGVKEVINNLRIAVAQVQPSLVAPSPAQASLQVTSAQQNATAKRQPLPPPSTRTVTSIPPSSTPTVAAPVIRQPVPAAQLSGPQYRDVTISAGSSIPVRITETLDSGTTEEGSTFTGIVTHDVVADGAVAIPSGSRVSGRVVEVHEAGHFKGHSLLSIQLTSVNRHGHSLAVSTDPYSVEGKGRGKNSAEKIGGGAAVGAILGGIFGGGKGAAIGAAAGGGGGAAVQGLTRGEQVSIPSESVVRFTLTNSLTVRTAENAGADAYESGLHTH